jgi:hypothetical protein
MNPSQVMPKLGSAELTIASSDCETPLKSDEPLCTRAFCVVVTA